MRMETIAAYLVRKREELQLLNSCLRSQLDLADPMSVTEVVRYKFQINAALRAEHALHDWTVTETAWAQTPQEAGPFEFQYDYQRADLNVDGPSFYGKMGNAATYEAIYMASGMAAIAALLLASAQVTKQAELLVIQGSYPETLELVEGYAPHLRITPLGPILNEAEGRVSWPRILLLDFLRSGRWFQADASLQPPDARSSDLRHNMLFGRIRPYPMRFGLGTEMGHSRSDDAKPYKA